VKLSEELAMADLMIHDADVAERLRRLAQEQKRSVDDVIRSMLDQQDEAPENAETEAIQAMLDTFDKKAAETSPLEALIGMFDDVDVTDLSIKASGHMGDYFVNKHDDSD
jgi:hypothetical protein